MPERRLKSSEHSPRESTPLRTRSRATPPACRPQDGMTLLQLACMGSGTHAVLAFAEVDSAGNIFLENALGKVRAWASVFTKPRAAPRWPETGPPRPRLTQQRRCRRVIWGGPRYP